MLVRVKDYRPSGPPHGSIGWSEEMKEHQGCVISVIIVSPPTWNGKGYCVWEAPSGQRWHFQKEWVEVVVDDEEYLKILESL